MNDLHRKLYFGRRPTETISIITTYTSNLVLGKAENKHLAPFGKHITDLCFHIAVFCFKILLLLPRF